MKNGSLIKNGINYSGGGGGGGASANIATYTTAEYKENADSIPEGSTVIITDDYRDSLPPMTAAEWKDLDKTNIPDGAQVTITDDYEANVCNTVQDCLDSENPDDVAGASALVELKSDFGGMKFGIDADGNYGYYKAGADSVTPFKKQPQPITFTGGNHSGTYIYQCGTQTVLRIPVAPLIELGYTKCDYSVDVAGANSSPKMYYVANDVTIATATSSANDKYIYATGTHDITSSTTIGVKFYPGGSNGYAYYDYSLKIYFLVHIKKSYDII